VHTDHATIKYLINKPNVNARIIRLFLLLQQFDLTIIDKTRKENVVSYCLSRLALPVGDEGMSMINFQMGTYFLSQLSLHGFRT